MGANWCNTLQLYKRVPPVQDALPHALTPWTVYAFEVSPLISPYVERCCAALSRGDPLPHAPVPPSGSSSTLLHYARKLNCSFGSRGHQFVCIEKALNASLHELQPIGPALASALPARLHAARNRGCHSSSDAPPSYRLLPAAAGARAGTLKLRDAGPRGLMQLLRGGVTVDSPTGTGDAGQGAAPPPPAAAAEETARVPVVDVVTWLSSSFSVTDHVMLKMDVEGAENEIVPALLASNASRLVDVLLWECHLAVRGGASGRSQCASWDHALAAGGVRRIYHDPYPFASAADYPQFP